MRKMFGAAVLFAVLMAFVVTAAAAETGGTDRPFTGTLAGSATFPLDSTCPFTGRRTWSEASGTASHLGVATMVSNHCTPLADVITGGQMTLVAADGDELHMTYSGTSGPLPPVGGVVTVHSHNVIVDGTGRFAEATGEADFTAFVTFAGFGVPVWPATWTWAGTISY